MFEVALFENQKKKDVLNFLNLYIYNFYNLINLINF